MNEMNPRAVCFGEILWDVFPHKSMIGGAPFNVAQRLNSYGVKTTIISSLGNDLLGERAKQYMVQNGLNNDGISCHHNLSTGQVIVSLDGQGVPKYNIEDYAAWDEIQVSNKVNQYVAKSDVFIFGSLAMRNTSNQATLEKIWPDRAFKVFDVNLRPPHFDWNWMNRILLRSDLIKVNHQEMCFLLSDKFLVNTQSIHNQCIRLSKKYPNKLLCVTMGENGAYLFDRKTWYRDPGYKVKVIDTVGSGDAFLATLIHSLILQKNDPSAALTQAVKIGSIVAAKAGANAIIGPQDWDLLLERNSL